MPPVVTRSSAPWAPAAGPTVRGSDAQGGAATQGQNPGRGGCSGGGTGPVPWGGGRRDTQAQCGGRGEGRLARNFLDLLFGPPDPSKI